MTKARAAAIAIISILIVLCLLPSPALAIDPPECIPWVWPDDFPAPPMVARDKRSVSTLARLSGVELPLKEPWVLIEKSKFKLTLYDGETSLKSYPVSLGYSPYGDKMREGDGKTPEGEFFICQKAVVRRNDFLGTRWMRLSYPNDEDAGRGLVARLVSRFQHDQIVSAIGRGLTPVQNTRLGGGIGIHGGAFDFQGTMVRTWTLGCIGMYNSDVEELYRFVRVGSRVCIEP